MHDGHVELLGGVHFGGRPELAATLLPDRGVDVFLAAELGRLDHHALDSR